MRSLIARICRWLETTVDWSGRLGLWMVVVLAALVGFNVFSRYVLGITFMGLRELEWHLLALIAMLSLSYTQKQRAHVHVDFVFQLFPMYLRYVVDLLVALLLVLLAAFMLKLSIPYAETAFRTGEGSSNPGGLPYRFIVKSFIPIGFLLLTLQAIATLLRAVFVLVTGREPDGEVPRP